jgi:hypothetical protein
MELLFPLASFLKLSMAMSGTLRWRILERISIKSLSHHHQVDGVIMRLGLHGSPKYLRGIQKRKQGGLRGCSFWMAIDPTSPSNSSSIASPIGSYF